MDRLLGILCSLLLTLQASTVSGTAVPQNGSTAAPQPVLEDGTPVKLWISQTVSSADAHVEASFRSLNRPRAGDSAKEICGNAIAKCLTRPFEVEGLAEPFQRTLSFTWITVRM